MAPGKKFRGRSYSHRAWLYSLVFAGKFSLVVILFLLFSFLIQPFHQAVASEIAAEQNAEEEVSVANDVRPQEEPEEPEEASAPPAVEEDVNEDDAQVDEDTATTEETDQAEDTIHQDDGQQTSTGTQENASSTDETNDDPGDSGSETGDGENAEEEPVEPVEPEELEDPVDLNDFEDTDSDSTATSSEDSAIQVLAKETIRQIESLVNDQNFYQFSRQSCAPVGDGAYHCTVTDGSEFDSQSVVYSAKGKSGNLEIFLKTSRGEVKQITDNNYDDSSPHYDPKSKRVVWQSLIDDRYQIFMYDIIEDKQHQLTFSRTNNMEPKVSNDGIVWQAWDDNDWEVIYFDGTYTDQITDNTTQDVTPVIEDGYILWTVIGKESQEARVYSIEKGEVLSIASHEGGAIANPRFVLVYDTKFKNGDIITQGFDPSTGLSAPIAAQAAPEPIDIPTPDPIGEIRALIQNKSSHEDEFVPEDTSSVDSGTSTSDTGTTTVDTLDLASPSDNDSDNSGVITASSSSQSDHFELTEYDLPVVFVDLSESGVESVSSGPRTREILEEELEKEIKTRRASSTQG